MKYCKLCVMPDTRPDLRIGADGICDACKNHQAMAAVDWDSREKEFMEILERNHRPGEYDCLIPVSGGKDSHFQTLKVLELGFKPLLVTATTDQLTDIGRRNIQNLQRMADYVEVTINPSVRNRIAKIGLETVGDGSLAEHMTIFCIPIREAVARGIKTIVWGENPQALYGGPDEAARRNEMVYGWAQEFGGFQGLRVRDLIEDYGFSEKELIQFTPPSREEYEKAGIQALFLGAYYKWDGWENAKLAFKNGFNTYDGAAPNIMPRIHLPVEGQISNYENLDNAQTFPLHDYPMWLKYGYGRASAIASLWIRNGRLKREEAIDLVEKYEGHFPQSSLGFFLDNIVGRIGLSVSNFVEICKSWTNHQIHEEKKCLWPPE